MQNLIIGNADFKQRRLLLYKILIFFPPEINLIENQKRKPSSHCSGTYCYPWSHSTIRTGTVTHLTFYWNLLAYILKDRY